MRQTQIKAIQNVERSLAEQHFDRSLVQMATGAVQTSTEFQNYQTPDDGRQLTDIYPVDLADMAWQRDEFERIMTGLAQDERPNGVSNLVADSMADLALGLRASAGEIELTIEGRAPLRFYTDNIHRDTWSTTRRTVDPDEVTVAGLLEKVDIHTHDLRIRDDVGNTLDLTKVAADIAAGSLINKQVQASGLAVRNRDGKLVGSDSPTIVEFRHHLQVGASPVASISQLDEEHPGPNPVGAIDLTDDEFAAFLAAIS